MSQLFKQLFPFAKPDFKLFVWASLAALPIAAIKGYQAYYVKVIFDRSLAPDSQLMDVVNACGVILLLQLLQYPLRVFHALEINTIVERITARLRQKIFDKFQRLPLSHYDKAQQGDLLSIATFDTSFFALSMKHMTAFFLEPLTAIVMLGVAVYQDWGLTLFVFASVPFFVFILSFAGKKVKKHTAAVQKKMGLVTQTITESILGHKIIKVFGLSEAKQKQFEKIQEEYIQSETKAISYQEHSHPQMELIGTIAVSGILFFAHQRINDGHLTTGSFISFAAALVLFLEPLKKFNIANIGINQANAAAERIFKILDMKEESEGTDAAAFNSAIEFKNVTFSYEDKVVLDNFSLTIKKGEKVALVGASGSGKSTILNLLTRLYDFQSGQILIDGRDIKTFDLQSLRSLFSYVGQDVFLINDSVAENLKLGQSYSEIAIEEALLAMQGNFLSTWGDIAEKPVGNRGEQLSGGQAQRIVLARGVLDRAPIVLLDEATSALDNETEFQVQQALGQRFANETVIAIAHRISTIRDYDRIILLKNGKIVEEGTHEQLLAKQGEYKKLYQHH